MKLEVNGIQYENFTEASCQLRLDALSSTFSFSAVVPEGQPLPFKGGEACKVIVAGEKKLTGFIEVVDVSYDAGDHVVTVSGRDKTGDLLDSSLDQFDDIRGDELSLKSIIEAVIKHLKLDIKVVDEVEPPLFNGAEDIAAPEPGDNAFEFIERYAKKRQVLLTSNSDGDVVIATNSGVKAEGAIQHIIGASDNNVISSNFRYDTTGRFNLYKVASDLNPIALNEAGDTGIDTIVDQSGIRRDEGVGGIRIGRQFVIVPDASASEEICKEMAGWEADLRRARGLVYSAAVDGYQVGTDTGDTWELNRIYQIVDDFVGKIEPMLSNAITFSLDVDGGKSTRIEFVGQNAYTLLLEPDPLAKEASNVA